MPHQHDEHCGHEATDHDHDHDTADLGANDNLFKQIDRDNVVALNTLAAGSLVIKPWHERLDETKALESDADDQIIIRIPFTSSVRLRSLLLKTGPGDQTPSKVALFANEDNFDFDDVADKTPTQEFIVAPGREVGEYALRTAKFSNLSSVSLLFPASQGADTTQIYYVGFLGHWTERKNSAVITVYETQANLADHEKIQGTDGATSNPGF
ncbi:PITH domain-containing protein [Mycena indigotica]|uniref:PITH domain-containing protein n=1 Tax=Mycena indigotica TaxID=2126181 RepID=A0A8H6SIJ1_9AGAR|nr:PITH domain-containing protein [Mycena indigotica]KAF7299400.1 PITH domain-containing protein [Mycena indigotica]